jgi:3-methylcrotonyl-CoA carboxylase beta subunit
VYLPIVGSGGFPTRTRSFPDRGDFGRIFYNQARMSSRGIHR